MLSDVVLNFLADNFTRRVMSAVWSIQSLQNFIRNFTQTRQATHMYTVTYIKELLGYIQYMYGSFA